MSKYTIRIIDSTTFDICIDGNVIKRLSGPYVTLNTAAEVVQCLAETTQKCEKNGDTFNITNEKN